MADAGRRRDRVGPGRGRRAAGTGPEAAAREARYAVLDEMAEHFGAVAVLLGHTLDDQAETVLLGLTRGSRRPVAGRDAPRRSGTTAGRCSTSPATDTVHRLPGRGHRVLERPAQRRPALHPGPGPHARCCRCSRTSSARAWPPPWPAPPTSSAPTSSSSTSSPRRRTTGCATRRRSRSTALARPAARRPHPGAPAGRARGRRARRRAVPRARRGARRAADRLARRGARRGAELPRPRARRTVIAGWRWTGGCCSARPACGKAAPPWTLADVEHDLVERSLHRGPDPGPARRAGPRDRGATTTARTC